VEGWAAHRDNETEATHSTGHAYAKEYKSCTAGLVRVSLSLLPYHSAIVHKFINTMRVVGELPALVHTGLLFEISSVEPPHDVIWGFEATFGPWFNGGSVCFYKLGTCTRMGMTIFPRGKVVVYEEFCTPAQAFNSFSMLVNFSQAVESHTRWNFVFDAPLRKSPLKQQAGNLNCQSYTMIGLVVAAASLPGWANQIQRILQRGLFCSSEDCASLLLEVGEVLFCDGAYLAVQDSKKHDDQMVEAVTHPASPNSPNRPQQLDSPVSPHSPLSVRNGTIHRTSPCSPSNKPGDYHKYIKLNRGCKAHLDMLREYIELLKQDGII